MNNYPKQNVSEKQIEIPQFLKEANFTEKDLEIESGCSEIITTVKKEMAREVSEDLAKVRNGEKIITENEREKMRASVDAWTEQEKKVVCSMLPSEILLEVIVGKIKELDVIKKEIAIMSRHNKEV